MKKQIFRKGMIVRRPGGYFEGHRMKILEIRGKDVVCQCECDRRRRYIEPLKGLKRFNEK